MSLHDATDWPSVLDVFGIEASELSPLVDVPARSVHERLSKRERSRLRFVKFHEANPHVYALLRKLALQLVRRGHRHLGAACSGKSRATSSRSLP